MSRTSDQHVSKKPKHGNLLPSHDEQKQLKQMDILMKNNLLGLQTAELIEQTKTEKKFSSAKFTTWIEKLFEDLKTDNYNPKLSTSDSTEQLHFYNDNITIDFAPPTLIEKIGALATNTTILPTSIVEIAVQIPNELFAARDILNHVYFDKRNLYLLGLYNLLSLHASEYKNIKFIYPKSDLRKPVIQLQPHYSDSIYVHIYPMIADTVFKLTQLSAKKNNVRPTSWMTLLKEKVTNKELDVSQLTATPFYNLAIFEDIVLHTLQKILTKAILPYDTIRQAIVLFQIWLTQRHLRYQLDGLDSMQIGLVVAYLMQTKRITIHATPISIVQSLWTFFRTQEFQSHVFTFFHTEITARNNVLSVSLNATVYDALVLQLPYTQEGKSQKEQIHLYNTLWRISGQYLIRLQCACKRSLHEMTDSLSSSFHHLFLTSIPFFQSADIFYSFTIPSSWKIFLATTVFVSEEEKKKYEEDIALHYPIVQYFTQVATDLVVKALGDRIHGVISNIRHPFIPTYETSFHHSDVLDFSLASSSSSQEDWSYTVTLGVMINHEKAFRKVDRGPAPVTAEDHLAHVQYEAELETFRTFWGEKCQLRRFKDGAIVEAVIWEPSATGQYHSKSMLTLTLVNDIVKYILSLHLPSSIISNGDSEATGEEIITLPSKLCTPLTLLTKSITSKEQAVTHAITAYDSLRSILLSKIETLPLVIESVVVHQTDLRYTTIIPPVVNPLASKHFDEQEHPNGQEMKQFLKDHSGKKVSYLLHPIAVSIQFESSGKWPSDPEAIQKCKIAMLIKLKRELSTRFQLYTIIHEDTLDVCYEGYLFRLFPSAGLELEKLVLKGEESQGNVKETEESLASATRRKWFMPGLYHNTMKTLSLRYPHFGESVQLFAYWIARHCFSNHIAHEVLELLVANELLHGNTFHPAANAMQLFYRTLIRFTAHHFADEPLFVDFTYLERTNGEEGETQQPHELTEEVKTMIAMKFQATRSTLATIQDSFVAQSLSPSVYIVTSLDKLNDFEPTYRGGMITPEPIVLQIMQQAAKRTITKLTALYENTLSWTALLGENESEQEKVFANIWKNESILKQCDLVCGFSSELVVEDVLEGPNAARFTVYVNSPTKPLMMQNCLAMESSSKVHPIQANVVRKLMECFHDEVLFFWDEFTGKHVGIMYRPDFKVVANDATTNNAVFAVLQSQYRLYQCIGDGDNNDDNEDDEEEEVEKKNTNKKTQKKRKNQNNSNNGSNGGEKIVNSANVAELLNHIVSVSEGLLSIPSSSA